MKREMVNFDDDTGDWIEEQIEAGEFDSKSALIQEYFEYGRQLKDELVEREERIDELEQRIGQKEERIDELEEQLARRSQLEDEIKALPDKIREEQTYRERRRRMLDQASLAERLKWKVTGVPVDDVEDRD